MRRSLFTNRNFMLLWLGQSVSVSGSAAYSVAMALWIKQATGSASLVGAVMMASALPGAVLGPIAGTAADLLPRRALIAVSDAIAGAAVLTTALAFAWRPEATNLLIVWILTVAALLGVQTSLMMPAMRAAVPDLTTAEELNSAVSLNQFSFQTMALAGQTIGAAAFQVFGVVRIFLYNSISYFFASACSWLTTIPQKFPDRQNTEVRSSFRRFLDETVVGFRYVWRHDGFRSLFLMIGLVNFFISPFAVLLPFYVTDFLKAKPAWFGLLMGAVTAGSLVSLLVFGSVSFSTKARKRIMSWAMPAFGLLFLGLGLWLNPYAALVSCFSLGFLSGLFNVNVSYTLQAAVPSEKRGRVFGLAGSLFVALTPLSMGATGAVADAIGRDIPLIYVGCAGLLLASSLYFASRPGFAALFSAGGQDGQEPGQDDP